MITDNKALIYAYYKHETLKQGLFVLLDWAAFLKLLERTYVYIGSHKNKITGLLIISKDLDKHYITIHYGCHEIKQKLLEQHLEAYPEEEIWIHFFNPDCLFWYPKPGIVHPCMQGVIEGTAIERFYLGMGFSCNSVQETYYRDLVHFVMPDDILKVIDVHLKQGISYDFYDALKHRDLHAFTEALDAPHWKDMILSNNASADAKPMLIALKNDQIVGFAGPLGIDTSHRGTFSGIGIILSARGQKIGKVLFFELCRRIKSMGATYMTLFTGTTNPARNIYLAAGFDIVARCVTLKYVPKKSDPILAES